MLKGTKWRKYINFNYISREDEERKEMVREV